MTGEKLQQAGEDLRQEMENSIWDDTLRAAKKEGILTSDATREDLKNQLRDVLRQFVEKGITKINLPDGGIEIQGSFKPKKNE